jgi:large subunit ribosomal protein L29
MADKKKAQTQDKATMGAKELAVELRTALAQRARLEFSHKVAPLKNPLELRHVRREIARLKTHLKMTEGAGSTAVNHGKKAVKEAAK